MFFKKDPARAEAEQNKRILALQKKHGSDLSADAARELDAYIQEGKRISRPRRIFATVLFGGLAGIGAVAEIGPTRATEVTIDQRQRFLWSDEVRTDKGDFRVGPSLTRAFRLQDTAGSPATAGQVYRSLRVGCTYRVQYQGRDIPYTTSPNIIAAEHVATAACPVNAPRPPGA